MTEFLYVRMVFLTLVTQSASLLLLGKSQAIEQNLQNVQFLSKDLTSDDSLFLQKIREHLEHNEDHGDEHHKHDDNHGDHHSDHKHCHDHRRGGEDDEGDSEWDRWNSPAYSLVNLVEMAGIMLIAATGNTYKIIH